MVHKTSLKGVERPTLLFTAIGTHYFRLCAMYLYIILLIDSVVQQSCDFFVLILRIRVLVLLDILLFLIFVKMNNIEI